MGCRFVASLAEGGAFPWFKQSCRVSSWDGGPCKYSLFFQLSIKCYNIILHLVHLTMLENLAQGWTDTGLTGGIVSKLDLQIHLVLIVFILFILKNKKSLGFSLLKRWQGKGRRDSKGFNHYMSFENSVYFLDKSSCWAELWPSFVAQDAAHAWPLSRADFQATFRSQ